MLLLETAPGCASLVLLGLSGQRPASYPNLAHVLAIDRLPRLVHRADVDEARDEAGDHAALEVAGASGEELVAGVPSERLDRGLVLLD